ncbi:putative integral membrane drug resistance protein [Aggregatibacter actinomycetemcomitans serotype e str. SC1083]|uniref:Putative integral membrane drug resistance protein n=1 Tax=Aggregatibacter actinomycetemcomitans serotype e str. SC1083 TaxID=907488 RepID=G4A6A5_AGGAC|nr:multidrug efflux SMR transporter [Aggregatibacter actinomycetemcomitans]EGY34870.1 putative integral membrane drug resistance protein [Aggregatibacter actinomycetemcomitans serotype e str. SC1083]KYK74647.1 transporter [Aggregatibacter actinomycetemcomitans serotype e str. SA3096]KYK81476.1 transporter [Aggregatibacter actinomycetemcomitans serotype e str. SC936]KYK93118.1 transporter [Aggregatibacter actinomycetemcomitans serotype e str. ANH9776]TYB21805.1 multidrug efflux SMR transporter 
MHWLFLALAIVGEVFGSSMLKISNGFSKLLPSVGVIIGFGCAFYFLSIALKSISLGTAYAIWAGVGLVLTALISVSIFGQKVDLWGIIGLGLILAGVIILNTLSHMGSH